MQPAKPTRWECSNQADAQAMIAWVNFELDRLKAIRERFTAASPRLTSGGATPRRPTGRSP